MATIDNTDKYIDSRQAWKQLEEMQEERDDLETAVTDLEGILADVDSESAEEASAEDDLIDAKQALTEWDATNGADYKALKAFCDEGEENSSEWRRGAQCIRADVFADYIKDWTVENGTLTQEQLTTWPFDHIDWDAAAEAQKSDYAEIDFDGETYLIWSS